MNKRPWWREWLALFICIIHVLPFYILLTTSFKAPNDYSSKWLAPGYLYLSNFTNAWREAALDRAIFNNLIVTVSAGILLIVIGSIASYPLARYRTRLNRAIFGIFVSALIVPPLTILVPLYRFMVDIGGVNQLWGIVLLHVTFSLPMTIFLYTGFIRSVPYELEESALIDGAGRLKLFYKILMPLLKPITATVVIITCVNIWNDYQFSVFFLQRSEVHTITIALSGFFSQYNNYVGWVAAGSLLGAIPITLVYLLLQRYFIQGLSSGAVKG